MSNTKTNIEFLQDIINAETFNKEEALEFLDSINDEKESLEKELDDTKEELSDSEDKVNKLEIKLSELEEMDFGNKIECGIGIIEYDSDNLQLLEIMEALGEQIKQHGALNILRKLSSPVNA